MKTLSCVIKALSYLWKKVSVDKNDFVLFDEGTILVECGVWIKSWNRSRILFFGWGCDHKYLRKKSQRALLLGNALRQRRNLFLILLYEERWITAVPTPLVHWSVLIFTLGLLRCIEQKLWYI